LIFVHLAGLDRVAHVHGPDGRRTLDEVREYDRRVGAILRALEQYRAQPGATLIVLGDHGLAAVTRDVSLDARLEEKGVHATVSAAGSAANVYLDGDLTPEEARDRLAADGELYETLLASEAATRWGYEDADRVGDLVLVARPGVRFRDEEDPQAGAAAVAAVDVVVHGRPPEDPDMAGTLLLWGRGAPAGQRWDDVSILDIYPTIRKLLGLPPANDVDGKPMPGVG
jgi:predicted AlkP superfamily pyrophosphatase or phosphodiesterase